MLKCLCAEIENDRLRHIRLHERVNELPDSNYATLKFFLGHLHRYVARPCDCLMQIPCSRLTSNRINQHAAVNSMSMQNLSIVFGPTLFSQAIVDGNAGMADATLQNVVRTQICEGYMVG
jgi:Rho GTPase-activating protein RGD1